MQGGGRDRRRVAAYRQTGRQTSRLSSQALQKVIPPLTNTAIVMVKNTSLVLIVGVFDMLSAARVAATDPVWGAPYVESYVFVALIYFLICFGISNYSRWLEIRVQSRSYR